MQMNKYGQYPADYFCFLDRFLLRFRLDQPMSPGKLKKKKNPVAVNDSYETLMLSII